VWDARSRLQFGWDTGSFSRGAEYSTVSANVLWKKLTTFELGYN